MSFDRVAPFYRTLERLVFGDQLQQARLAFVREIETPRRVLIVGEGDGRFLAEFVRLHPRAKVDCVDASARMMGRARARLGDGGEVRFVEADLRDLVLEARQYDLIVTHFFLDCFQGPALREVLHRLSESATADAVWLLADFRIPESGWQRLQARFWIRAMYFFFRLTSGLEAGELVDPSLHLESAGFRRLQQRLARCGMIKTELWRRSA